MNTEQAIHRDPNQLLSIKETAKLLGCAEVTVRKAYYAGKLPQPIRIAGGRKLAYRYGDLIKLQEQWASA